MDRKMLNLVSSIFSTVEVVLLAQLGNLSGPCSRNICMYVCMYIVVTHCPCKYTRKKNAIPNNRDMWPTYTHVLSLQHLPLIFMIIVLVPCRWFLVDYKLKLFLKILPHRILLNMREVQMIENIAESRYDIYLSTVYKVSQKDINDRQLVTKVHCHKICAQSEKWIFN